VSNMFIVSLAIADLIVGLCVMPIGAIYIFTVDWMFGVAVCQFWIGVDYTASTASILNLFILSLDRYWSVTSPLKYIRKRTKKRALIMISLVWSGSCLWLIPILGWHHFEHGGIRTVPTSVCETEYATNTGLKIVTGILNYYLPLAFMYALYIKIFIEIHKRSLMEIGQRNVGNCVASESLPVSGSMSDESGGDEKSVSRTVEDNIVISNHLACYESGSSLRVSRNGNCTRCSFKAMKPPRTFDTESDQTDNECKQSGYRLKKSNAKHRLKPSRALTKEIKAARQLGVILGAFTLCFFPYFVCFMVVAFCVSCVSPDLMTAVTWVGYLNSTLNPFLYPLCNAAFRRKFRKMLNLKAPAKDIRKNSLYFSHNRSQVNNQLHSGYSLVE
ncbi:hypothetical protein CAPTEDRAFT_108125, partial [Capitella teleta]